jgi:hypothetical protein
MMPTPEIAFFTADRSFIEAGEAVQLSWRVQGAGTVHLEAAGVVVPVAGEGTLLLAPQQNTTYLLVATAAGGANRAGLTVAVRPKLAQVALPVAPVASPTMATLASSSTVESPLAPPIPAAPPAPAAVVPARSVPEPADASTTSGAERVTPMATATPAPVETAPAEPAQAAPATHATAGTLVPERSTMVLMVVGLVALVGLPTGLMAAAVVVWLVRRGVR